MKRAEVNHPSRSLLPKFFKIIETLFLKEYVQKSIEGKHHRNGSITAGEYDELLEERKQGTLNSSRNMSKGRGAA